MITTILDFVTRQFAFSQNGVSQSAWFWAIIGPPITWKLAKAYYKKKYAKEK